MTGFAIILKEEPRQRIDLASLTEKIRAARKAAEIEKLPIFVGNRKCVFGDLFVVYGKPGGRLVFDNVCGKIDGIGSRWREGILEVYGDAGDRLGHGMTGGTIIVHGNAGDFAASDMRDGDILIEGNAGNFLGAPLTGERAGMNGGVVRVEGNAGARTGDRLRRGLLLIEGDVGELCASRMIAGSIAVMGHMGPRLGHAMRRGALFMMRPPARFPDSFNDSGAHTLPFHHLFLAHLKRQGGAFSVLNPSDNRLRKYVGDISVRGSGALLFYDG